MLKKYLLFLLLVHPVLLYGQCITTFPYVEDFENNNGNWVVSGTNSDWSWGHPSKSLITGAGSAQNCWITGGLTSAIYNGAEKSWIESPCFDFSSLTVPYIRFLIFWDTERYYDGGNLQYSTDGGISWVNLGANNEPGACLNANWFNLDAIYNLSGLGFPSTDGWSGNTDAVGGSCRGSGGSAQWVTASHCMQMLAGQTNVNFRFTFCSGTSCNAYDGIAVDSIYIAEAPAQTADFALSCVDGKTISVNAEPQGCASAYLWDFGDGNTDSGKSLNHSYKDPGQYIVSLTTSFECAADVFRQKNISIISATVNTYEVTCKDGTDGAAAITIANAANPTIRWNVNPVQNADSINNLAAGNYTVTVSDPAGCTINTDFEILYGPEAFPNPDLGPDQRICPGSIIVLNPGTFLTYLWNDNSVFSEISVDVAGTYSVRVENNSGCTADDSIVIKEGCGDNIWIPNAFTPNGDQKNDILYANGIAVSNFEMNIFNRWGQMLFYAADINSGWNGLFENKEVPEGVYGYSMRYTLYDGKSYEKEGTVLLMR